MGTGELRTIHSRVAWMSAPVDRSITVSAPQRTDHASLSTSSSTEDRTGQRPPVVLLDVGSLQDPGPPEGAQALPDLGPDSGLARPIGVGAAGVVEEHRRVLLRAVARGRRREADLPHRDAEVRPGPLHPHLAASGAGGGLPARLGALDRGDAQLDLHDI